MLMQTLPRISVPTLSELAKCEKIRCQGQEQGAKHLGEVVRDFHQEAPLVVHLINILA